MEFLGGNFDTGMVGGSGTGGWSGSFGAQKSGATYSLGTTDLLRQVKKLMVAAKEKKII